MKDIKGRGKDGKESIKVNRSYLASMYFTYLCTLLIYATQPALNSATPMRVLGLSSLSLIVLDQLRQSPVYQCRFWELSVCLFAGRHNTLTVSQITHYLHSARRSSA